MDYDYDPDYDYDYDYEYECTLKGRNKTLTDRKLKRPDFMRLSDSRSRIARSSASGTLSVHFLEMERDSPGLFCCPNPDDFVRHAVNPLLPSL